MRRILFAIIVLLAITEAYADPYCEAESAADRGDYALVYDLMLPLAQQGDAYAQGNLAIVHGNRGDQIVSSNDGKLTHELMKLSKAEEEKGFGWILKAALQGNPTFQRHVARAYMSGAGVPERPFPSKFGVRGNPRDKRILDYWKRMEKAKSKGNTNTEALLAYGIVREKSIDEAKAIEWMEKAAIQGDIDAQYWLGRHYDRARGADRYTNRAKAQHWLLLVAEQGHAHAQYTVAFNYSEAGQGQKAIMWYRKVIAQEDFWGNHWAISDLADMYKEGDNIPRNDHEAAKLYRILAEKGGGDPHYELGLLLSETSALPKDIVTAYAHFSMADALDTYEAKEKWSSLAGKMTSNQISEGQALAGKWWSKLEAAGGPTKYRGWWEGPPPSTKAQSLFMPKGKDCS